MDEAKKKANLKKKMERKAHKKRKLGQRLQVHKESDILWPPGKWRLGKVIPKAKHVFMRYSTKADKKLRGAEKRSEYYKKFGNPNYGGMTGLISNSRKRKMRVTQQREEVQELKAAIQAKRATITYDDVNIFGDSSVTANVDMDEIEEFGAAKEVKPDIIPSLAGKLSLLDQHEMEEGEIEDSEPEEVVPPVIRQRDVRPRDQRDVRPRDIRPKDVLPREDRRQIQQQLDEDDDFLDLSADSKPEVKEVDEEAVMMEQELDILLASPPRKRSMRMYADDIEDEKNAKSMKRSDFDLTIFADRETDRKVGLLEYDDDGPSPPRVQDARQKIRSASRTFGGAHMDGSPRRSGNDLRSKLQKRKSDGKDNSKYQRMRIEVYD
ncbi:nuclear cap-binding protein subunit 3-like isoform X2 [Pecten maximus]|uniref:nuclear cap-binding protein subunit 3-like isoform X2 n=1 Tax=Pecten maximus TaxID=6579 RepID=UPI001458C69E|nr:nuclear cap-binding protein subunit 3-like isoform X2 [Pecten maximus]